MVPRLPSKWKRNFSLPLHETHSGTSDWKCAMETGQKSSKRGLHGERREEDGSEKLGGKGADFKLSSPWTPSLLEPWHVALWPLCICGLSWRLHFKLGFWSCACWKSKWRERTESHSLIFTSHKPWQVTCGRWQELTTGAWGHGTPVREERSNGRCEKQEDPDPGTPALGHSGYERAGAKKKNDFISICCNTEAYTTVN